MNTKYVRFSRLLGDTDCVIMRPRRWISHLRLFCVSLRICTKEHAFDFRGLGSRLLNCWLHAGLRVCIFRIAVVKPGAKADFWCFGPSETWREVVKPPIDHWDLRNCTRFLNQIPLSPIRRITPLATASARCFGCFLFACSTPRRLKWTVRELLRILEDEGSGRLARFMLRLCDNGTAGETMFFCSIAQWIILCPFVQMRKETNLKPANSHLASLFGAGKNKCCDTFLASPVELKAIQGFNLEKWGERWLFFGVVYHHFSLPPNRSCDDLSWWGSSWKVPINTC